MALLLATCPQDRFRNAKRAIEYAQRACNLTNWRSWQCIDTLAAAFAEAGQFDQALELETRAAALTTDEHVLDCAARRALYSRREPYRYDWKVKPASLKIGQGN